MWRVISMKIYTISKEDFIKGVKPNTRKSSEIINNQEAEKQAKYCYKPYRTLHNY